MGRAPTPSSASRFACAGLVAVVVVRLGAVLTASRVVSGLSTQVSRVTRCTSARPPVESRRHGARSESNCLSFLFTPYISVGMGISVDLLSALLDQGLGLVDLHFHLSVCGCGGSN